MSDYTLLEYALSLGGRVVSVDKFDEAGAGASLRSSQGRGVARLLSKAHIRPFVEYRAGASLLKSHKGGEPQEQIGGGKRGDIKGFSDDARRRLLYTVQSVRRDSELPL